MHPALLTRRSRRSLSNGSPVPQIVLTGLSSDSIGAYARIGNEASIGYTINPDNGTDTVAWDESNPATGATYGTGANPTALTALDGAALYCHVTDNSQTVTRSVPVRFAPGSATGALPDQNGWNVDAAITPVDPSGDFTLTNLTGTWSAAGLPSGLSINSGTGAITGTPTATASGSISVIFTDQYGRTISSSFSYSVTVAAPTAAGGLADQSFTENTGTQTYATAGDFTGSDLTYSLTTSVTGVTINSGTGVVSFDTNAMAVQSGTSIVVQATNSGGSITSGFSLAITSASSAVNPSVSADNYTAPTGGNAANFDVTGSYAGADTLDLYAVLGTSAITVTEAQLIAGSGGTNTIEFFNIQGFSFASGDFDITGLTAASEAANELRYVIVERNNGGTTGVLTATDTITNLDFTVPTFSSAEVGNIDADTVRVTLDSAMYGSTVAGDWTLTGNTISSVSFTAGNTYVDLTLGTTATGSDDYTGDLSFTGTSLKDVADNALATFSGENVTNNVGGGNSLSSIVGSPRQTSSGGNTVLIFENIGAIGFTSDGNFTINYEFVGGGAQGGGADGISGGGGGGGGRVKTGSFSAVSGQTYSGIVGAGGSTSGADADGQNGGASGITSGTNFPGTAAGGGGGGTASAAGLAGGHGGGAGGGASSAGGATNDGGNAGGSNTGNGEGAGGGGESAAGNPNTGGPSYEGGDGAAGVATTVPGETGNVGNGGGGGGGPTGGAGPNGAGAGVAWSGGNGNAATGVGNGGGGAHGASGVGGTGSRGQVAIWFTP